MLILTYFFNTNWWMYIGTIIGSIFIGFIYLVPGVYENFGTLMDKFFAFAKSLEKAIGNPMYHWCHLELKNYFGY